MLTAYCAVALLMTAEPPSEEVANAIKFENHTLNKAFKEGNPYALKELMTDDHVAITTYYGAPMNLADQIASLADTKIAEFKSGDVTINMLSKDVAQLTYMVTVTGTYKGQPLPARVIASAVWVRRGDRWREASYQETPMPVRPGTTTRP